MVRQTDSLHLSEAVPSVPPVVTASPGEGGLEGGRQVEQAPGQDHVVVGAQEEGDDDGADTGALQQRAQLAQGTDGTASAMELYMQDKQK